MAIALTYQPFAGLTGANELIAAWEALRQELSHYLDDETIAEVLRAAVYGAQAHEGQMRQSGEPYFVHPIAVSKILAAQRFDLPVLQAGLLHDVLEDTPISKAEMAQVFGTEVTAIVDGVSKLDRLKDQAPQEAQADSFKKMLVAMTDDPRVIIIKLADRLHNMQTLGALRPDKRIRKARETLDVYASIAGRLGLFYFRIQLEDLAFSHLHPWRYAVLQKHYQQRFTNKTVINRLRQEMQPQLMRLNIQASISKRQRHLWGVYLRMKRKQSFDEACRTIPVRIITQSEDDCYRVLGVLHKSCRPISGKFEDYIAAPKSNGYRSLHSSVLMKTVGAVLNVQIRTRDMHSLAETGIIAVWHQHLKNISLRNEHHNVVAEKYMRDWLSRLREVQNITDDPLEFYDAVKKELSSGDIHVYTPTGQIIDLPHGATPVDFAYAIHSEIGNHCVGAKVNGLPYAIFRPLQSAQTVEIITDSQAHPHAGWLQFVVTAKARAGVNHHLRSLEKKEARTLGMHLLDAALHEFGSDYAAVEKELAAYAKMQEIEINDLLDDIAYGRKQSGLIAAALLGKAKSELGQEQVLYVHSALDSGVYLGECCHPLNQDAIIGHIERGKGIQIHRRDCVLAKVSDGQDWLRAEWAEDVHGIFNSKLVFVVQDRPKMLSQVAQIIGDCGSNITDLQLERLGHCNDQQRFIMKLEVQGLEQLEKIMQQLRLIDGISQIERV